MRDHTIPEPNVKLKVKLPLLVMLTDILQSSGGIMFSVRMGISFSLFTGIPILVVTTSEQTDQIAFHEVILTLKYDVFCVCVCVCVCVCDTYG
jgi:hypothetical protein